MFYAISSVPIDRFLSPTFSGPSALDPDPCLVEIFFSQYLANFETRGCGGDFSTQNFPPTHRFRDICKKRLILYGDGEKDGKRGLRGVLGRLDSDRAFPLEQFDWEKTSRCDGCF